MAQIVEQKTGRKRKPTAPLPVDGYASNTTDDDMSPQSAPYTTNSETLSDREMRSQEVGQNPDEQGPNTEISRTPYRTINQAPQPRVVRDVSDDMSPTSGGSDSPFPQESAWDRIRREAASGQSQSPSTPGYSAEKRQTPRQESAPGDSFTFSATDEERQLAKQDAQKDFDARVERERQGRDFEDSTARKKW
jgi:hypothetical protein